MLYSGLSAVLISINAVFDREVLIASLSDIVTLALARAPDMPVFLYGESRLLADPPMALMERIDGYLYLHEDTAAFMAGYVSSAIHRYLDAMLPHQGEVEECLMKASSTSP